MTAPGHLHRKNSNQHGETSKKHRKIKVKAESPKPRNVIYELYTLESAGRALRGLDAVEIRSYQRPTLKQGWGIAKTITKTNAPASKKAAASHQA